MLWVPPTSLKMNLHRTDLMDAEEATDIFEYTIRGNVYALIVNDEVIQGQAYVLAAIVLGKRYILVRTV